MPAITGWSIEYSIIVICTNIQVITITPVYNEYAHAQCLSLYRLMILGHPHLGFAAKPISVKNGKTPLNRNRIIPGTTKLLNGVWANCSNVILIPATSMPATIKKPANNAFTDKTNSNEYSIYNSKGLFIALKVLNPIETKNDLNQE
jgi:hypothetical protein